MEALLILVKGPVVDLHNHFSLLQYQKPLRTVLATDRTTLTTFRCHAGSHGAIDIFSHC